MRSAQLYCFAFLVILLSTTLLTGQTLDGNYGYKSSNEIEGHSYPVQVSGDSVKFVIVGSCTLHHTVGEGTFEVDKEFLLVELKPHSRVNTYHKRHGVVEDSIRFEVFDIEGKPLKFATVILLKESNGYSSGGYTDENGFCALPMSPEAVEASVSLVGYGSYRFKDLSSRRNVIKLNDYSVRESGYVVYKIGKDASELSIVAYRFEPTGNRRKDLRLLRKMTKAPRFERPYKRNDNAVLWGQGTL